MTYRVRITPAVADDLTSRDLAGTADADGTPNPYRLIDGPGTITLTAAEAGELLAQARHDADPDGPLEGRDNLGLRNAFLRLARNLEAAGVAAAAEPAAPFEPRTPEQRAAFMADLKDRARRDGIAHARRMADRLTAGGNLEAAARYTAKADALEAKQTGGT